MTAVSEHIECSIHANVSINIFVVDASHHNISRTWVRYKEYWRGPERQISVTGGQKGSGAGHIQAGCQGMGSARIQGVRGPGMVQAKAQG